MGGQSTMEQHLAHLNTQECDINVGRSVLCQL